MTKWERLNNFTSQELENEEWKQIEGFDGRYEVSSLGRVKSNYGKGRILKPAINKYRDDYWIVHLRSKDKSKMFRLNRLVAEAFIPNPENKPEVNHINEFEKWNNRVSNLEWMTRIENENYGTCHQRATEKQERSVIMIDDTGADIVKIKFKSQREVERKLGFSHSYIGKACKTGTRAYGYSWEYVDGVRKE